MFFLVLTNYACFIFCPYNTLDIALNSNFLYLKCYKNKNKTNIICKDEIQKNVKLERLKIYLNLFLILSFTFQLLQQLVLLTLII